MSYSRGIAFIYAFQIVQPTKRTLSVSVFIYLSRVTLATGS